MNGKFLCTADQSLNGTWITNSCPVGGAPCSGYLSCEECKADDRCGYCQATQQFGKCFTKYYDKFCLSAAWAWNPSVCRKQKREKKNESLKKKTNEIGNKSFYI